MKAITTILTLIILAGCAASFGTPEERLAINKTSADLILCEKLALNTKVPEHIRNEWAIEVQNRGVDCSQFHSTIAYNLMRKQEDERASQELLNYSTQMLKP